MEQRSEVGVISPALRTLLQGQTPAYTDWPAITREADTTLLAPLLYSRLHNRDDIPEPTRQALRQTQAATGLRNRLLLQALDSVLQACQTAGIRVMVLKGAALAQTVYADIAQRPMRDVDLQVSRADWSRIPPLLRELGWERAEPLLLDDTSGLIWHAEWWCKPGTIPLNLEIHSRWLELPDYDAHPPFDLLWQHSQTLPDRPHWRVLTPDDQLLHLCAHAVYHHDADWPLAEVDLVQVLSCYGNDLTWDQLLQSAETHHLVTALQTMLPRLAADWDVPLPQDVLADVMQLRIDRIERRAIRCRRNDVTRNLCLVRSLPLPLALRYITRLTLPPAPYMVAHWNFKPGQSLLWAQLRRLGKIGRSVLRN